MNLTPPLIEYLQPSLFRPKFHIHKLHIHNNSGIRSQKNIRQSPYLFPEHKALPSALVRKGISIMLVCGICSNRVRNIEQRVSKLSEGWRF